MFTGIVEEMGALVVRRAAGEGTPPRCFDAPDWSPRAAAIGDSIAVNGCCLTVVEVGPGWWAADVVDETLGRTNLGRPPPGRSGQPGAARRASATASAATWSRVTSTASARSSRPAPDLRDRRARPRLARYLVEKGSITVDGVSLTVVEPSTDRASPSPSSPTPLAVTTLGRKAPGDRVNLEVDVIAKYAERLLTGRHRVALQRPRGHPERPDVPAATIEEAIAAIGRRADGHRRRRRGPRERRRPHHGGGVRHPRGDGASSSGTPPASSARRSPTSGPTSSTCRSWSRATPSPSAPPSPSPSTTATAPRRASRRGDRSSTARALVDPATRPADLARPGHLHVLRAREGGVLKRAGHTEAAVDLARLAGLTPAGVLCEVVTEDGLGMARLTELEALRRASHGLLADHHRRPHPLPPPDRAPGPPDRRGPAADRVRRVPLLRLPERPRPGDPPGVRDGRAGRRGRTCWSGCTASA